MDCQRSVRMLTNPPILASDRTKRMHAAGCLTSELQFKFKVLAHQTCGLTQPWHGSCMGNVIRRKGAFTRKSDMTKNEGTLDRTLRVVAGLALIALAWSGTIGAWGWIGVVPRS